MLDEPLSMRFDAQTHSNAGERIAAWRDAFSLSVDVHFRPDEIDAFAAAIDFFTLGPLLLTRTAYTAHTVVRDRRTVARTGREQFILDVWPEGGAVGTVGGHPCRVAPGDCFLMDMRGTLHLHLPTGRFIGLILPRRLVEVAAGRALTPHGLVFPASSPQARLLGPLLAALADEARNLPPGLAQGLGDALVPMIAACIGGNDEASAPLSGAIAAWAGLAKPEATLVRLRRHIVRHAADPAYDPEALGRAYGLSRSALYRLFRPHGGVAEAIRRRRATLAVRMLTQRRGERSSFDVVARASGFADVRAMRRALRAIYDATPVQLHRQRSGMTVEPDEAGIRIGTLFDRMPLDG